MGLYKDTKRYYGKDVLCPGEWVDQLNKSGIPSDVLPLCSNDLLKYVPKEVCAAVIFHNLSDFNLSSL